MAAAFCPVKNVCQATVLVANPISGNSYFQVPFLAPTFFLNEIYSVHLCRTCGKVQLRRRVTVDARHFWLIFSHSSPSGGVRCVETRAGPSAAEVHHYSPVTAETCDDTTEKRFQMLQLCNSRVHALLKGKPYISFHTGYQGFTSFKGRIPNFNTSVTPTEML